MITSSQNSKIQLIRRLIARRKDRMEERCYVAEGVRLLEEAYNANIFPEYLLFTDNLAARGKKILMDFSGRGVDSEEIDHRLMESISDTESTQGLLGVFRIPEYTASQQYDFLLVIDELRDPGNLGTILRTAEAGSVQAIFLTPGTTDAFSPKVVRAGMGAHFRLPIFTVTMEKIRGFCNNKVKYFGTDVHNGKPYWHADFRKPTGLIIGGEAAGISHHAKGWVDETITIPMSGEIESLNAAVATGILIFEVVRQRADQ